jgi:hypothetical protein
MIDLSGIPWWQYVIAVVGFFLILDGVFFAIALRQKQVDKQTIKLLRDVVAKLRQPDPDFCEIPLRTMPVTPNPVIDQDKIDRDAQLGLQEAMQTVVDCDGKPSAEAQQVSYPGGVSKAEPATGPMSADVVVDLAGSPQERLKHDPRPYQGRQRPQMPSVRTSASLTAAELDEIAKRQKEHYAELSADAAAELEKVRQQAMSAFEAAHPFGTSSATEEAWKAARDGAGELAVLARLNGLPQLGQREAWSTAGPVIVSQAPARPVPR